MTTPDVVKSRQPNPSDGQHFVRTFRMRVEHIGGELADNAHEHIANLSETVQDAIRRGLRPTGEAVHVSTEPSAPGHVVATYQVPVAVTPAAATVSAEGEQENDPAQTTLTDPATPQVPEG